MVCSGINQPARGNLDRYLRTNRKCGLEDYLRPLIDIKQITPKYIGPALKENEDIWGVRRRPVSYGESFYREIDRYPLAEFDKVDSILKHRWPSTDWFDYSSIAEQIECLNSGEEYCIAAGGGIIFETSWYMRGFEQIFMDMALAPGLVDCIMGKVTDFFVAHTRKILEAADGKADLCFSGDDLGGQQGLLMSVDMIKRFIKPHHKRLNSLIHSLGARVIYHTDGAIMEAVPDLIDMGIDILQALQFDARGMDPVVLKEKYGRKLCFEGGISVQKTLPFGTFEDVQNEVRERILVLGRNGGYILGPAHAIQAGTPPENIVAMFDTAAMPL